MSVAALFVELREAGVVLAAMGDQLRVDAPAGAISTQMRDEIRQHKEGLLRIVADEPPFELAIPDEEVDAEEIVLGPNGWPLDCVPIEELTPCSKCNTYDLWQSTTGVWRCQRCDPPSEQAIGFLQQADRIQANVTTAPTEPVHDLSVDGCKRCGSQKWVDVPIHEGRHFRRDCAGCGRFIDFIGWD